MRPESPTLAVVGAAITRSSLRDVRRARLVVACLLALVAWLPSRDAVACTIADAPPEGAEGAVRWWGCSRSLLDARMDSLGIRLRDWDGYGHSDPCNVDWTLGRHLNAVMLLDYASSPRDPHMLWDRSDVSIVYWAKDFVLEQTRRTRRDCATSPRAKANAFLGRVTLYQPYWEEANIIARASTLVHEARHLVGGCGHNGYAGGRCSGSSCDAAIDDGCDERDDFGANAYQVLWLAEVAVADTAPFAGTYGLPVVNRDTLTTPMRQMAAVRANMILDTRFEVHPGWCLERFVSGLGTDEYRYVASATPCSEARYP